MQPFVCAVQRCTKLYFAKAKYVSNLCEMCFFPHIFPLGEQLLTSFPMLNYQVATNCTDNNSLQLDSRLQIQFYLGEARSGLYNSFGVWPLLDSQTVNSFPDMQTAVYLDINK